ncbi:MAG TPA: PIN domain-containing protein, partial [Anaerolineae bacterium]|nr:PIN domain-containing protein [Anaerolineae bacterium]
MAEIFADTSGWAHLLDSSEPFHHQAAAIYRQARDNGDKFITTSYVLLELISLLTSPMNIPRASALNFIKRLAHTPTVEVLHINAALDQRAWDLLAQRQDKLWSLTDAAAFIVMADRNIFTAYTSDHHFEQAGFIRLL